MQSTARDPDHNVPRKTAFLAQCAALPAITILFACGLFAPNASAGSEDEALVDQGIELRRAHKDAEALEQFRRAAQIRRSPRAVAQIALAEQALAQWVDAEKDLTEALGATDDPWIGSRQQLLRASLDAIRGHVASLSVESSVSGAELWVNDRRVGALPGPAVRVASGTVRIEVRSTGYETVRRSLDIAPGQVATEKVALAPESPAVPAPTSENTPAIATPTLASPVVATGSTQRFVAWGMLSAAGAFLGGALAAQVFRETKVAHWNNDSKCWYGTETRGQRCGTDQQQAEAAQTFANVGYVAAGACAISATLLFLIEPHSTKNGGRPSLSISASASTVFLGYTGEL